MAARWVAAQDLFDAWSQAEESLAFERAGGSAYDFALTPPVANAAPTIDLDEAEVDEFAVEDALLDSQTTATLRVMSADLTRTIDLLEDDVTGTLPAMA